MPGGISPFCLLVLHLDSEAVVKLLFHVQNASLAIYIEHTHCIFYSVAQFGFLTDRLHCVLLTPDIQNLLNLTVRDRKCAFLFQHFG